MKVLSLFDGMSCGRLALEALGIHPEAYFAAEIKPHAIKVTQTNFPDTIQLGDVRQVTMREQISCQNGVFQANKIDLLIGGSPCQDLSLAMKNRKGLAGDKSSLFYEYVRIWKEVQPTFFFLENVGTMAIEDARVITQIMGVPPVRIDSRLVSAQSRDRLYWTNIPGTGIDLFGDTYIEQPKDKHIMFADILENGSVTKEKAVALTARDGGASYLLKNDKWRSEKGQAYMKKRAKDKGFMNYVICDDGLLRLLTRRERERLQTVPEGYTDCVTEEKAANLLGDGWTVDVVKHCFTGLKQYYNNNITTL